MSVNFLDTLERAFSAWVASLQAKVSGVVDDRRQDPARDEAAFGSSARRTRRKVCAGATPSRNGRKRRSQESCPSPNIAISSKSSIRHNSPTSTVNSTSSNG